MEINPQDIRIDSFIAGTGYLGGTTGIRITHLPSGIISSCSSKRGMWKNRSTAMIELKEKVKVWEQTKNHKIESLKDPIVNWCFRCNGTKSIPTIDVELPEDDTRELKIWFVRWVGENLVVSISVDKGKYFEEMCDVIEKNEVLAGKLQNIKNAIEKENL